MTSKHIFLISGIAALVGGVCGGVAGGVVSRWVTPVPAVAPTSTSSTSATSTADLSSTTSSTVSVISLVPVERRAANPLLPPAFFKRRIAGVGVLYRKPKGVAMADRALGADRFLSNAVSLTSDGWFAAPASTFDGLHLADVVLWHSGVSYAIDRGSIDHVSGVAFFHVAATGLSAPAFTQSRDASVGGEVWLEPQPNGFVPGVVLDIGGRIAPNDAASSEIVSRRMTLDAVSLSMDRGGAVWDPNGSLIGIIENTKGGERVRVIPASAIANSLSSILSHGDVTHALLGITAIDVGVARFDALQNPLPSQGALVQDVKKDSPAAKAKLKTGDVILRVEHDILDGTVDLGEILADYRPGTSVTLTVHRGTGDVEIPVTLGTVGTSEPLK